MNVEPLKASYSEARRAQREYAASVRKLRQARLDKAEGNLARARLAKTAIEREDEALKKAYAAIAAGCRVFNMNTVLRDAGLFEGTHMPKIAIVRADAQVVRFHRATMDGNSACKFTGSRRGYLHDIESKHTMFSQSLFGEKVTWEWRRAQNIWQIEQYAAVVPFIPPRFRPANLENYFVMWEPLWRKTPPAPDPFLLRALGSGLFAVVAQWDMTPLEQSILEGRIG
jgi:hypothetical protein